MLGRYLQAGWRVLDVGTGDGLLARCLMERSGAQVQGIDVLQRDNAWIPVTLFDGLHIPFADNSFDALILVDVVHHAADPLALLSEVVRVTRDHILIKDHLLEGWFAQSTLQFMDWVGNARHHVHLPYNYWPREQWRRTLSDLHLQISDWTEKIPLYPWPFSWIFGRRLHFIAQVRKCPEPPQQADTSHS
jgi:SAM-dependent methyltransferase